MHFEAGMTKPCSASSAIRRIVPSLFTLATVVACSDVLPSSEPEAVGAESSAVASANLEAAFRASGFVVGAGKFSFLDMSACCAASCAGNNPSSPYAAFYVPPAPGQAPEPNADERGLSNAFRLRADEAIVFVGPTPPEARYFGFTPYLTDRSNLDGTRRSVAASLSETLNNLVIKVDAPAGSPIFERTTAIVAAADATTTAKATNALVAAGVPRSAINAIVFDPALGRFGLKSFSDTFSVLFRVALPTDPAKLATYIANPAASVYRLTPSTVAPRNPLPSPAARPKDTTTSELALTSAVDRLQAAITAAYPGFVPEALPVDDGLADPLGCIEGKSVCAFDNRDTTYPAIKPRILFPKDDEFYVVYGVDHQVTRKVSYANVSVYAMEHLVGIQGVSSNSYPGSAQRYLSDSEAPKLYAWKIARNCAGEAYCLEVPKGGCPTGIENGKVGSLAFRTYLEPTSKTAPSPSTLVRDRVLRFRRP